MMSGKKLKLLTKSIKRTSKTNKVNKGSTENILVKTGKNGIKTFVGVTKVVE